MAFDVRPLRAKIGLARPDLERTAQLRFCVDEAVRDVCRRTFLARYTHTAIPLSSGNPFVSYDIGAANNILKVHRLDMLNVETNKYEPLRPESYMVMAGHPDENGEGTPWGWSQQGDTVRVYPIPIENRTLRLEASYVPTDEPDSAPLPELAVMAVEARAEALALAIPGAFQDKVEARSKEMYYRRCIGALKDVGDRGEVGEVKVYAPRIPGVR
jgi:hypothetical protein